MHVTLIHQENRIQLPIKKHFNLKSDLTGAPEPYLVEAAFTFRIEGIAQLLPRCQVGIAPKGPRKELPVLA